MEKPKKHAQDLWLVTVIRTAYREKDFLSEAENHEEAKKKALEIAPGEDFPAEHDADYEVESVQWKPARPKMGT